MIAEVIVDLKNKQVNQSYDYIIPEYLEDLVLVGQRVIVPFGRIKRTAFIINIKKETEYYSKLKEIDEIIDDKRILDEEFIELAKYISANYFSFFSSVLDSMIPRAFKYKYEKIFVLKNKDEVSKDLTRLFRSGKLKVKSAPEDKIKLFYKEVSKGNIEIETVIKRNISDRLIEYVKLENEFYISDNYREKELIEYLIEYDDIIEKEILLDDLGYSINTINNLVYNKAISILKIDNNIDEEPVEVKKSDFNLTLEQEECYKKLELNKYDTYLLFGVTGSGKTELYMRWIEDLLKEDKEAIILVPEISLTPQMSYLFKERFGNMVSVLHSRLKPKEKYEEWKKIINGNIKIVVGARSAIFAPLKNLGIIIIDEEHDGSYIQITNPKYDAKDVALWRSKRHNIPLVLASATPLVSDYHKALSGEYKLLSMKKRVNGEYQDASIIVDMTKELKEGNKTVFSRQLRNALINNYNNHEQAILFLNRRGFSSFVMCRNCGYTVKCPHCDMTLTYHKNNNLLICHQCGFKVPNVTTCARCGSDKIKFVGTGTEKIYEETRKLLPKARILRADTYERFKNNEADILIGTQMITKGLDFSNVTLVGIMNASLSLNYPSYDAKEVTYELIEQASGRAGRREKKGISIIQSYNVDDYAITSAAIHDYETFYKEEIKKREIQKMPPFSLVYEIIISSRDEKLAKLEASNIITAIDLVKKDTKTYGPIKDKIYKLNDIFRYNITVFVREDAVLKRIEDIYPLYQQNKDVKIDIRRL